MHRFRARNKRKRTQFVRFENIVGIISIIVSGIISIYALQITVKSQEKLTERTIQKESLELLTSRLYEYGKIFKYEVVGVTVQKKDNVYTHTKLIANVNQDKDPIKPLDKLESALASSFLPEEFTRYIEEYIDNEREEIYSYNELQKCVERVKEHSPDIYNLAVKPPIENEKRQVINLRVILESINGERIYRYSRVRKMKEYINTYAMNNEIVAPDLYRTNNPFMKRFDIDHADIYAIHLLQCVEIYSDITTK